MRLLVSNPAKSYYSNTTVNKLAVNLPLLAARACHFQLLTTTQQIRESARPGSGAHSIGEVCNAARLVVCIGMLKRSAGLYNVDIDTE